MPSSLTRELTVLRWSTAAALLLAAAATWFAVRAGAARELTAERINVVDADGTVRLVIANKDRMPRVVLNGQVLGARTGVAGMIFYNDQGDENGGLVYRGGPSGAGMSLTLDQFQQDQTIGVQYTDGQNGRMAGVSVWDRPDAPLTDYFGELDRLTHLPSTPERDAALKALNDRYPTPKRVFVGKTPDRSATLMLADGQGRPRLQLKVAADGEASLEFLDDGGRVTRRIPAIEEGGTRGAR